MSVSIGVFCGTKDGNVSVFKDAAYEVGMHLAKSGYRLVYGAGHIGMMGQVSKGAIEARGEILGVVPLKFVKRENAGHRPHPVWTTKTLEERKTLMFRESDAFVALPGGYGTFDEFYEVLTLSQTGGHTSTRQPVKDKPLFFLNTLNYFEGTLIQMDTMVKFEFLSQVDRDRAIFVDTVDELMAKLAELK